MLGRALTARLQAEGHHVAILSRSPGEQKHVRSYKWDVEKSFVEQEALQDVDVIVNLAGAPIVGSRWTKNRKRQLYDSRIKSTELLHSYLADTGNGKRRIMYLGASAIGYYGDRGNETLTEESKAGEESFLVNMCKAWEAAHMKMKEVCQRVCIIRIGLVLSSEGGILPRLNQTVILGSSGYLGDGAQYMSWIHIDDLLKLMISTIRNDDLEGVYNGISPHPVTNKQFMKRLVRQGAGLHVLVPVPAFALRMVMGEMASTVLESQRVLPERLGKSFKFTFPELKGAFEDLLIS